MTQLSHSAERIGGPDNGISAELRKGQLKRINEIICKNQCNLWMGLKLKDEGDGVGSWFGDSPATTDR